MNHHKRIVVTGGPGGGKSTAVELFRRELGERVIVVPESATMLFAGGFPRHQNAAAQRAAQRAIFHVQRNLEDVQAAAYPDRLLLCDRGTADGAAYWPGEPEQFFEAMGTSFAAELARYDGVIFFESAAAGGHSIEGGNPARTETNAEAARLDLVLQAIWKQHPRYAFIRNERSFFAKLQQGIGALTAMSAEFGFPLAPPA
ncbi:MAG: ATP-binding protein [Archangium sp.]|nr:ATP-binding protein [Archangium sp.]